MKAKQNKKTEGVIDNEIALDEKKQMQKIFVNEHSYRSHVLDLLIEHFEEEIRKQKGETKK